MQLHGRMERPIWVLGYVGGRRARVGWFRPEGNGMRFYRVLIGPLHGIPNMDCYLTVHRGGLRVNKAHESSGVRSSGGGRDLSEASDHCVIITVGSGIAIRKHCVSLLDRLCVIEGLIMRERQLRIENMNGASHVFMDKAYHLEISRLQKFYGVGASTYNRKRVTDYAC